MDPNLMKAPRAFMPAYMDAQTLAYTLSLSVRTIDTWVERGLLPKPLQASGKRLWRWRDVAAAMDKLCEDADRAADLERIYKATPPLSLLLRNAK